jgi:hypothetical protein
MNCCFNNFLFLDLFPFDNTVRALEPGEPQVYKRKNKEAGENKPKGSVIFWPLVPEKQ